MGSSILPLGNKKILQLEQILAPLRSQGDVRNQTKTEQEPVPGENRAGDPAF
jgi:hypothetical protein